MSPTSPNSVPLENSQEGPVKEPSPVHPPSKVGVVGAGIAGISAAIRLAVAGAEVHVFDQNSYTGGKLTAFILGGYRFDAGPSLFTLPHLVDELFALAGRSPREHFDYHSLDRVCTYYWPDGTALAMHSSVEQNEAEIKRVFGERESRAVRAYFEAARKKYDLTAPFFLEQSLHRMRTFLDKRVLKVLTSLPALGLLNTLDKENKNHFRDPRLVQLFNRYATYNGSSPYQTPGIMQMITHLEHGLGAFLPVGGMHEISQSLTRLAQDLGVTFHLGERVERIVVEQGKVQGLEAAGRVHPFDQVVCNSDVKHAYTHLLPKEVKRPAKTLAQQPSSSALIFYWGIGAKFDKTDVHTIFFSEDYQREFERIHNNGPFWEDPTIYVHVTSKVEPQDAPEHGENWFVMINVPADQGQDWDRIIPMARAKILERLSKELDTDVEQLIEVEDVLEPRTIASRTSSVGGALYGTSSNDRMAAFLRHPNKKNNVEGLYFCGGSAHPGGGVPLCLLSGKIAAEWWQDDNQ